MSSPTPRRPPRHPSPVAAPLIGASSWERVEKRGCSVAASRPDPERDAKLTDAARAGIRVVKLRPTVQAFCPDAPEAMALYVSLRLGLVIFFHGDRAVIEPEFRRGYALPRH